MRPTALVLDLDGVVLNHAGASRLVRRRIVRWLRGRVGSPDLARAATLNEHLYRTHGHTWRGLRIERADAAGSLDGYNAAVYDGAALAYLRAQAGALEGCRRHLGEVLEACAAIDAPVYIFSNAPVAWCATALDLLGAPAVPILVPEAPWTKPDAEAFVAADASVRAAAGARARVVFVDDSSANLRGAALSGVGWELWHFGGAGGCTRFPTLERARGLAALMSTTRPGLQATGGGAPPPH